jgi:hypothetical protein
MVFPALVLLVSIVNGGCSTMSHTRDSAPLPPERTVRIEAQDFGKDITVRVGDVLRVDRPANYEQWDVAYADDVLRSLNTDEGRRQPPADGWTFAVVARGTTDLLLTPIISRGGTPNVPKFVVTITAQ